MAVTRHEIALDVATDKDFGLSGVDYSKAHGAYFGVNSIDGSLWRIDPLSLTARNVALSEPRARACSLVARPRAADRARAAVELPV